MNRNSVRTIVRLTFLLFIASQAALAGSDPVSGEQLTGTINYRFAGHLGQTDGKGRTLVWEAEIEGDLQGTIKWWFTNPPPSDAARYMGGRLTFYAARWELWNEEELILAGESAGKTDFRDGADGIWDGHGRVTEANGEYRSLKGRLIYESGPVVPGDDPPRSYSGTGLFLIY
jgi:hypothetical protein